MKCLSNTLVTILTLILTNPLCYSQTYLIPQIGISQSAVVNDNDNDECAYLKYDEKMDYTSLTYGMSVLKKLHDKWALKLKIKYKKGGSKSKGFYTCASDSGFNWVEFSYLDFNPGIEYSPFEYFWLELGVLNSMILQSRWDIITFAGGTTVDVKDRYAKLDNGLFVGFGGIYKNIRLSINYQYGLKKIVKEDSTRWLQLALGYQLQISKRK